MSGIVVKSLKTVAEISSRNFDRKISPVIRKMASAAGSRSNTSTGSGSSSNSSKLAVEHDTEGKEFYIKLTDKADDDSKAVLQYDYISPDYVDLEHTVVPAAFRGHGIAKILAETAFDHFINKGAYIRPTCTYLQKFYNENPLPRYKDKVKWD